MEFGQCYLKEDKIHFQAPDAGVSKSLQIKLFWLLTDNINYLNECSKRWSKQNFIQVGYILGILDDVT